MQISSFSIYVADVLKRIDELAESNAGLPVFLLGHSMVRNYCCLNHCHNIIIICHNNFNQLCKNNSK